MAGTDKPTTRNSTTRQRQKFLVFRLGNLRFGLKILDVEDIIELGAEPPHKASLWPLSVRYGSPLPVVDLRSELKTEGRSQPDEEAERYFILVVKTECYHRAFAVGLVVERVAEVVDLDAEAVESTDGRKPGARNVKLGAEPVSLLDLEQVLESARRADGEAGWLTPGFAW